MASLFKNGHFKNVQFRKMPEQIYSMFLCGLSFMGTIMWEIVNCGNYNVIVAACNNPVHDTQNFYVYYKNESCIIK